MTSQEESVGSNFDSHLVSLSKLTHEITFEIHHEFYGETKHCEEMCTLLSF